jgi:hypothetical protein
MPRHKYNYSYYTKYYDYSDNSDNPDSIDPGSAIHFPRPYDFLLPPNSIFEITFQVTLQNTGELVIVLNGQ